MLSGSNYTQTIFSPTKGCRELLTIDAGDVSDAREYHEHELVLYVRSGSGLAWMKTNDSEYMSELSYGGSVFVPKGATVQFKNNHGSPLNMNLYTMPITAELAYVHSVEHCHSWDADTYSALPDKLHMTLKSLPDYIAADGSEGRSLVTATHGKLNNFTLKPGTISTAVKHAIVEEIWFVESGRGEMWMKTGDVETNIPLTPGASFVIPVRTTFQFRNMCDAENLTAMVMTMPPWPGDHVIDICDGPWEPTVKTPGTVNPLHATLASKINAQQLNCSSSLFESNAVVPALHAERDVSAPEV